MPTVPEFVVTYAGLNARHQTTSKSRMTLHMLDCSVVRRARKASQDYLNGWVTVPDGRPLDYRYNERKREAPRNDAVAVDSDLANDLDQVFGDNADTRAAYARLWVANGQHVCGRCHPEVAVAEYFTAASQDV